MEKKTLTRKKQRPIAFGMDYNEATAQQAQTAAADDAQAPIVSADQPAQLTAEEQYRAEVEAALAAGEQTAAPEEANPEAGENGAGANAAPEPDADEATKGQPDIDADEEEPQSGRARRFRVQANDEVEARALELKKHNRDLSLEECVLRAKHEFAPTDTENTDGDDGNSMPRTSERAREMLVELRQKRKEAMTSYEFDQVAELDDNIESLRDHMDALREHESQTNAQMDEAHRNEFIAAVDESKERAVKIYPDVADPVSALVNRMVEIDQTLMEDENPLYFDPNKPLKLAQMAANDLGIAPRSAGSKPATQKATVPPQPKAPSAPVVPASGNARTTSSTNPKPGGLDAELDRVNDTATYKKLVAAL